MKMTLDQYLDYAKQMHSLAGPARKRALTLLEEAQVVDAEGNPLDVTNVELEEQDAAGDLKTLRRAASSAARQELRELLGGGGSIGAAGAGGGGGLGSNSRTNGLALMANASGGGGASVSGGVTSGVKRYGALVHFKGADAQERAYRFGMWNLAAMGHEGARQFCASHGLALKVHQEGVNSTGGFTVPDEFQNDLIDLREQFGVFRRNAKIVPMAGDTRSDPRRTGGLTAYFVGESGQASESTKGWDRVNLTAKKLMVLTKYSSELSEDAVLNIGDDLAGEIAYAFAQKEDDCGFNGDGTSTYGGIVGVRSALSNLSGTIGNIAGLVVATGTGYATSYDSVTLGDFNKLVGLLPEFADGANARWYCSKTFWGQVMQKLAAAAGGVTSEQVREGGRQKMFLGYPVEIAQQMPRTPAVSQVCCLLGDLRLAARFGDRRQTTIDYSNAALNAFEQDELVIRGTERFDIVVHDVGNASATAALRQAGPIVGLITASS